MPPIEPLDITVELICPFEHGSNESDGTLSSVLNFAVIVNHFPLEFFFRMGTVLVLVTVVIQLKASNNSSLTKNAPFSNANRGSCFSTEKNSGSCSPIFKL